MKQRRYRRVKRGSKTRVVALAVGAISLTGALLMIPGVRPQNASALSFSAVMVSAAAADAP